MAKLLAGLMAFETNYVMATVGLYVPVFNLFTSPLSTLGLGGPNE